MYTRPQFPNQVWDGDTESPWRTGQADIKAPDSFDWDRVVAEVIATQEVVKNLSQGGLAGFVKIGWFACPSSLGVYHVTGVGFKPKRVSFFVSKGPGLQTHFCCCQGAMDIAGNQHCMTWAGVWSNIFKGDSRRDKCMYTINSSGVSQVTASFVSMDDDGFTLNFENANSLFDIHWEAIG